MEEIAINKGHTPEGKCLTIVANIANVAKTAVTRQMLTRALTPLMTINDLQQRQTHVWDILCDKNTTLTPDLRAELYRQQWDFALQDTQRAEKKLFLSDMDATIVVGETIDDMAKALGLYDEISAITAAAMQGEIDYQVSLKKRLMLLAGIPRERIVTMANQVHFAEGAAELLQGINQRGMDSCLVSGGFSLFTAVVAKKLGFRHHVSNQLSYDANDRLDGGWIGEVVTADVKAATLKSLAEQNGLSLSQTVAIGDGANDVKMVSQAGLGVAFYGKPAIRAIAQAEIHSGNIDNLLWFLS